MPSTRSHTTTIDVQDAPLALVPVINSFGLLTSFYQRQRSQYLDLVDSLQVNMERTLTTLFAQAKGPQTFHMFGQLPPELRIKIWQEAMPAARTVVVESPFSRRREAPTSLDGVLTRRNDGETWHSNTQIPALLHVNSEARHEALKHYTLALGTGDYAPRIYVDFSRDTLFFGQAELKPECSSLWGSTRDLARVQRLAVVPEGAWRVLRWGQVDLNSLQKMTFVYDTHKLLLGPTPQLVEDVPEEELEELIKRIEDADAGEDPLAFPEEEDSSEKQEPLKMRMQAAREELDTLAMVLPTQWEKEPSVSTATFKKTRGDKWA
ncbi:hypothetical protein PG993_010635 [Apiospora rasikravindrae]|uniref:2EXR domain-containing protein n=1 Tax=Apiospora rasikravindrae TaxID=990691 RepID=A0ABR1SMW3_9PEZI